MKKNLFLTIIFVGLFLHANAQDKKNESAPKSNLEEFSIKSGTFSEKEITDIGVVKGLTVQVMKITNLLDNTSQIGIRFSGVKYMSYGAVEKIGVLDADEVDAFIKTLAYINEKVFTAPVPQIVTEFNFYARGGVSGGAFATSNKKKWNGYVQLSNLDNDSNFYFEMDDFKKLGDLINQAKSKL